MKYKVQIWCSDCTGEDFQGCNDGQPWYIEDENNNIKLFDTYEQADDAGQKETIDNIYKYEVQEVKELIK